MALTYKGKHHRNPSGFKNKVKWLLSESKWNQTEMSKIVESIDNEKYHNWSVVLAAAYIQVELRKASDLTLCKKLVEWQKRNRNSLSEEASACLSKAMRIIREML